MLSMTGASSGPLGASCRQVTLNAFDCDLPPRETPDDSGVWLHGLHEAYGLTAPEQHAEALHQHGPDVTSGSGRLILRLT